MDQELTYYNLALVPESDSFSRVLVELARVNLTEQASGYMLGEQAIPHVTICQFQAQDKQVDALWNSLSAEDSSALQAFMPLVFSHIYIKPGKNQHLDKYWVGLAVQWHTAIFTLQNWATCQLAAANIESLTLSHNYFPHLTLARCKPDVPITLHTLPAPDFFAAQQTFVPTIGLSDAMGIYRQTLHSL